MLPDEPANRAAPDALTFAIGSRHLLIVLDNCEHLIAACSALVDTLVQKCRRVHILATSLQALGLPGERVWLVPPLAFPAVQRHVSPVALEGRIPEIGQFDAVRLFMERARHVSASFVLDTENFEAIATICGRLEGIPLALELAAARVKLLSPVQIAERLDDVFRLLTHGVTDRLPRHQTLRATMDWSYALLSPPEQLLQRRLSIFAGPFTLDAVESVAQETSPLALDLLTGLVDKSLVFIHSRDMHGEASFRLLETVRQYAREKLEDSGEAIAIRDRYLKWCMAWAERAEPHLTQGEPGVWIKQFELHQEHFRATLRWACTGRRIEQGLRLANALARFWMTGDMAEGRGWPEELLNLESTRGPHAAGNVPDQTRAQALLSSGRLAVRIGDDAHGAQRGEESLSIFRAARDSAGIVAALNLLALAAQDMADYTRALALYAEALDLSRQTNNTRMTGVLLVNEGLMYYEQQDFRRASPLWEEANDIAGRFNYASTLDNLACLAMMRGDFARAQNLLERELQVATQRGDKHGEALTLMDLGEALRRQGELDRAQALLQAALERHQQMSNTIRIGENLVYLAHLARNRGQIDSARDLYEQSVPHLEQSNYTRYLSHVYICIGLVEGTLGRAADALRFLRKGLQIAQQGNHGLCRVEALEDIADLLLNQNKASDAARLFALAGAERERLDAPVPPIERERHDRMLAMLRDSLSEREYLAIQSRARELVPEQVVRELLQPEEIAKATSGHAIVPKHSAPSQLRIYALGPARVLVGERALANSDWTYTKSKELFFYLFLNPPASKAEIGLALWPEASPDQLRNIFHRALHYLRKALGGPSWITFGDGLYAPAQDINLWCDVREFESRLARIRSWLKSGTMQPAERAWARQLLAEAVELWRGDFLAGMDAGEWGLMAGEALRRAYIQALMDMGQLYVGDAGYAGAIGVYQRVLASDNYFEAAHRELMRCYARQGEASRALAVQLSASAAARRTEADPSPETTRLYERLRRETMCSRQAWELRLWPVRWGADSALFVLLAKV